MFACWEMRDTGCKLYACAFYALYEFGETSKSKQMTPMDSSHTDFVFQNNVADSGSDFWVFGYGSLMWRPGFDSAENIPALLTGFSRSLCIYSHVYRGTPELPGLVLGLNSGGFCHGQAFRVTADNRLPVMNYLREREQISGVYVEKWLTVELADGRDVEALVYVADPLHKQYAGGLSAEDMALLVRRASGQAGPNRDYVANTARHLQAMDIRDERLEAVLKLLDNHTD